ncbi:hypothetical protein [Caudoviricetes sp.]|nr:hypothetical protein [Caudoviricetes sp.]
MVTKFGDVGMRGTKISNIPEGTEEELRNSFKHVESYLYRLLDYSTKEEGISKEELDEARRIFLFAKYGPRAGYLRFDKRLKLTSADVLYILTTSSPSSRLSKIYGLEEAFIKHIRRGTFREWYFEYSLIRRLKAIIKHELKRKKVHTTSIMYVVYKLNDDLTKNVLFYTTSRRKAVSMRAQAIPIKEINNYIDNKTLDIYYPIEKLEVYS